MYHATFLDGVAVVKPEGSLDITNALPFRNWVRNNILKDGSVRALVIDLSEVEDVDSFAMGIFIALYKDAKNNGMEFALMKPQEKVKRALEITSIDKILPIVDSVSRMKGRIG